MGKPKPLSLTADWDSDEDELLNLIIDEWGENEDAAEYPTTHRTPTRSRGNKEEDAIINQRNNVMATLRKCVEALVSFYERHDGKIVDSDDPLFTKFVNSLEAALTFGIWIEDRVRPKSRWLSSGGNRQIELEVLWSHLGAVTEFMVDEDRAAFLAARSFPDLKDVGRARAWMRLSLIDRKICDYIDIIHAHPRVAEYHPKSILRTDVVRELTSVLHTLGTLDFSVILNFDWCALQRDQTAVASARSSQQQEAPMASISPGLLDEEWFHGRITASHALQVLEPYHFLVRESNMVARAYTVSVHNGQQVKNFRVRQAGSLFYFNEKQQFKTISELVQHYSTHGIVSSKGGPKMMLNKPAIVTRPGHRKPTSEKPWIAPSPVRRKSVASSSEVDDLRREMEAMRAQMEATHKEVARLRQTNAQLSAHTNGEPSWDEEGELEPRPSAISLDMPAADPSENTDLSFCDVPVEAAGKGAGIALTASNVATSCSEENVLLTGPKMAATDFELFLAQRNDTSFD